MASLETVKNTRLLRAAFANELKVKRGMKLLKDVDIEFRANFEAAGGVVFFLSMKDEAGNEYFCDVNLNDIRDWKNRMAYLKNQKALCGISEPFHIHAVK